MHKTCQIPYRLAGQNANNQNFTGSRDAHRSPDVKTDGETYIRCPIYEKRNWIQWIRDMGAIEYNAVIFSESQIAEIGVGGESDV